MKQRRNLLLAIIGFFLACFAVFYLVALRPNTKNQDVVAVYIPSTATYEQALDSLEPILRSSFLFNAWARIKKYPELVKPGRYLIYPNSNNRKLVQKLRGGLQDPLEVRLPSKRTYREVLGAMAEQLECDSASLVQQFVGLLKQERGIDTHKVACFLIPNTYEFYWNGDCQSIAERMLAFYHQFWTPERKQLAKKLGLDACEVHTLAAIVQKETAKEDEMPIIAGVYLNRLNMGMRLQADPTLVFAIKDRKVTRVLNADKNINSPYNTYKYAGLPPGPIWIAEPQSLDAVLHAESHKYLYFCASESFNGYHNFAVSYREHLQNAAKYQRELNRRRIYR